MGRCIHSINHLGANNNIIGFPLLSNKKQYDNDSIYKKRLKYWPKTIKSITKLKESWRIKPKES